MDQSNYLTNHSNQLCKQSITIIYNNDQLNYPTNHSNQSTKVQSNLSIKGTQGYLKMCPLWAVALYIQVKIICINGENEAALYRQWFVI